MAGILDEFNKELPSTVSYCHRISVEDFERQGAEETQSELEKLLEYLDNNPKDYYNALRKRKRDELGFIPWFVVKVMTAAQGKDYLRSYFPEGECEVALESLKRDLISAYDYGQEAAGSRKRFSERLAHKKKQAEKNNLAETPVIVPVPPPPPLPIMPSKNSKIKDTEDIENKRPGKRRSYGVFNGMTKEFGATQVTSLNLNSINNKLFTSMKNVSGRGERKVEPKGSPSNKDNRIQYETKQRSLLKPVMTRMPKKFCKTRLQINLKDEIADARKKLRCINPQSVPESQASPSQFSKQQREATRVPDQYTMFNEALVYKFRNARSPLSTSPSDRFNNSSSFCSSDSPA